MIRALRPHQWSKNLLVFVPQLLAHQVLDPAKWAESSIAFLAFSLCASSVYLLNDAIDVESDRAHPQKRHRPFASGALPVRFAYQLTPVLVLTALTLSVLFLPRSFVAALVLYLAATTLYSTVFNRQPLADVLLLAGLYALRIFAGAKAVGVTPSPWLLGFSMFFFLSLAFLKRYVELVNLRDSDQLHRNRAGYLAGDLVLLLVGGLSCGYLSVLVFALYVQSPDTVRLYHRPMALWSICPVLLYWLTRIWFVAHRGKMNFDPVVFALRDRLSLVLGITCIALVAAGTL